MNTLAKRAVQVLPVLLLVALTAVGLASAFQSDEEEIDYGPQATDFVGDDGVDIASYLVAVSAFSTAPPVPLDEEVELRVFGCNEDSALLIEFVPRGLLDFELEANEELDEDDEDRLLDETVELVQEDTALPEPATYELIIPENAPIGFGRFVHTCTDVDGEELQIETVINVVVREDWEEAQEDLDEPQEVVTLLDSENAPS